MYKGTFSICEIYLKGSIIPWIQFQVCEAAWTTENIKPESKMNKRLLVMKSQENYTEFVLLN